MFNLYVLKAASKFLLLQIVGTKINIMSGKRKVSKKGDADETGLSKEQDSVARFVRFNCPTNTTMFQGNEVQYFNGSKAVDTLMDSKYGSKAKSDTMLLFPTRQAAVNYMRELMNHQLFFRARKLVPKKKEEKDKRGDANRSPKNEKRKRKEEELLAETETEDRKDNDTQKKNDKDDDDKKKKKKVKLEIHDVQVFNDDKDVYVWVFDPTPLYKKIIGLCMVLGTIVGCLFPLWPMWLRQGVYYLSLVGIGAFGLIVVVAILRTILFGIIWLATMGQHKLWILPNLTEDCGFFESFQPWYTYEYCPRGDKKGDRKKGGKSKKDKDSDDDKSAEAETMKIESDLAVNEANNFSEGDNLSDPEGSASEGTSSVPSSPTDGTLRKRSSKREGSDFVMVQK